MQTAESLAAQVLALAKSRLMADLRFMSTSLDKLDAVPSSSLAAAMAADGQKLYYNTHAVLSAFKAEQSLPAHILLHVTLHCLLGHPFQKQEMDKGLWNIASDIAVEEVITQLELPIFAPVTDEKRQRWRLLFSERCPHMTAQEVYGYLLERKPDKAERAELGRLFAMDSHALWYGKAVRPVRAARRASRPEQAAPDDDNSLEDIEPIQALTDEDEKKLEKQRRQKLRREWKQLARQAEADLKIFSRRHGTRAGALMDNLAPITFEECDYGEFLRRFGTQNETMRVSDDEFDVIYYTYGLKTYGNIPLIEPLEYRDDKLIREFVIAIDTSGSVQGEIVQSFLQRTCDVLRQSGSFTQQVNIYLVQCDAEVQSVEQLTSLDGLEALIPRLRLRGFGGTDFRPVFDYVDELLQKRRLTNLNGLLYFTDGEGTYPEKAPDYKTAFIFNRDDSISPSVPSWAIRAVLTTDNIRLLREAN